MSLNKGYVLQILTIFVLLLTTSPAGAVPPQRVVATNNNSGRAMVIPEHAIEIAPNVFSLGTGIDPQTGKQVEGLMFVHYRDGYSHKPNHDPGSSGGDATTNCYSYLASGAKWKSVENWIMNSANSEGLGEATLFALQDAALAKWEDAADGIVGTGIGFNIFGSGSPTFTALSADTSSPDGQNEVYFGDVGSPGAIAVTIVWGYFGGRPSARQLIEWDQVYDQVDFDWSAEDAGVSGKMDFYNIAVHEDGHAAGMGHPSDSCTEETMYRYGATGETKKRDLNAGDIAGVNKLY